MQSGKIAIQNAQVVLENGILWDGVILIEDGKIVNFGSCRELEIPGDYACIDFSSIQPFAAIYSKWRLIPV